MNKKDEVRLLTLDALCNKPPVEHLSSPLNYIFAEHFRQRVLFGLLDSFVEGLDYDVDLTAAALDYLMHDIKLHILDEEQDLFPRLLKRAEPDDEIDGVINQLLEEHKSDHIDATQIIEKLKLVITSGNNDSLDRGFAEPIKRFTANERRHLIVENAIVLPLARARLTEGDLVNMSRSMAKRRGIQLHEKHDD